MMGAWSEEGLNFEAKMPIKDIREQGKVQIIKVKRQVVNDDDETLDEESDD